MKSLLVALVVLAALIAASEAGPAPARKLKPLAEILKNDPSPSAADSVVVAAAASAVDSRKLSGCFEPGCIDICQRYSYPGGYCSWGECMCWY